MTRTSFEESYSIFDSKGCLLDWNDGFESEFSTASTSVRAGASFRDILHETYQGDQIIRVYLPDPNRPEEVSRYMHRWPQDLGTKHTFKYWNGDQIINVQETRTVSRGIIRIATATTNKLPEPEGLPGKSDVVERHADSATLMQGDGQDRLLRTAALETSNSILLLRLRTEQKLKELSLTDGLTGLANRRHFTEVLESRWQRALKQKLSIGIAILDVDNFKLYNDHYGHSAGDTCLRRVAAALEETMRHGMDLVARYGGEEFAIILPGADNAAALGAAERARATVAALNMAHEPVDGTVTVSIGVAAQIPTTHNSVQELINRADIALYKAKALGRNRTVSEAIDG